MTKDDIILLKIMGVRSFALAEPVNHSYTGNN